MEPARTHRSARLDPRVPCVARSRRWATGNRKQDLRGSASVRQGLVRPRLPRRLRDGRRMRRPLGARRDDAISLSPRRSAQARRAPTASRPRFDTQVPRMDLQLRQDRVRSLHHQQRQEARTADCKVLKEVWFGGKETAVGRMEIVKSRNRRRGCVAAWRAWTWLLLGGQAVHLRCRQPRSPVKKSAKKSGKKHGAKRLFSPNRHLGHVPGRATRQSAGNGNQRSASKSAVIPASGPWWLQAPAAPSSRSAGPRHR